MTEKKWLKIGEAAQLLGVSPKELRYWESVIPEIRPRRSKGNLRYYHREELPRLARIRDWLGEGLTVADCQQLLATGQLRRGLGLEVQTVVEEAPLPAKKPAASRSPRQLEQAREVLSALLERLTAGPRPAKRKHAKPEAPAPPPEPPRPTRSRKKPAPGPADPDSFGPLFD
jgi:DNA-binding transcriptional MerR regulator